MSDFGQLIGRLDKDKDGKMTVSIVVGNLSKVGSNGTGASRNHKLTVDGKQFDTVAIAWKETMGDIPQPTKEVQDKKATGGKRQSATKDVAVTALEAAGHKVS